MIIGPVAMHGYEPINIVICMMVLHDSLQCYTL